MLKDITLPPVREESQAVICCGMYVSLLCIVLLGQTLHTLQPFHNVFPASSLDHSLTTLCDTVSLSIYLCRVPTVPFGNQMGGQNYIKFGRTGCLPSQGMIIPAWEDVLPYLAFDPLSLFHRTLNKISKWIKSPVIYLFELSKFSLDDICPSPPHHLLPVCGGGGGVEQSRDGGGGGDLHVLPACLSVNYLHWPGAFNCWARSLQQQVFCMKSVSDDFSVNVWTQFSLSFQIYICSNPGNSLNQRIGLSLALWKW